ncbi:GL26518 [Drosophila persimilis]|uniref:GL26518 n=1 Tax=Drosophila persimilis TaxID=7234 RepID=B4GSD5_DROPE|nr:GL26518 [Drosophila persimilis]
MSQPQSLKTDKQAKESLNSIWRRSYHINGLRRETVDKCECGWASSWHTRHFRYECIVGTGNGDRACGWQQQCGAATNIIACHTINGSAIGQTH